MSQAGVKVFYSPVFGSRTPQNWQLTWHGRQQILLEAIKLAYYKLVVMPKFNKRSSLETGCIFMQQMHEIDLAA
jgi:hypothetical protein